MTYDSYKHNQPEVYKCNYTNMPCVLNTLSCITNLQSCAYKKCCSQGISNLLARSALLVLLISSQIYLSSSYKQPSMTSHKFQKCHSQYAKRLCVFTANLAVQLLIMACCIYIDMLTTSVPHVASTQLCLQVFNRQLVVSCMQQV